MLSKWVLGLAIVLAVPANAATTEEKLAACDAALSAKVHELDLTRLGVQIRQDELVRLQTENSQLRSANTSLFSNPFVWGAIGAIIGVYAGARATR